MKNRLFSLSLFACLLAGLYACSEENEHITKEATLRWTGMVAADGCGYFLDIDGKEYKPANEEIIPESFQKEEPMQVRVTYETLKEPQEFSCGMMPTRYTSTIRLTDVQAIEGSDI